MEQTPIDQLQETIRQAQKLVDFGVAMERLLENRDFSELIVTGYLEKEAARLTGLLGRGPSFVGRADILEELAAIAHFRNFMHRVIKTGQGARQEIAEAREDLADEMAEISEDMGA